MVEHPRGYDYVADDERKCYIEGLQCDFGYIRDPIGGEGCVLDNVECEDGATVSERTVMKGEPPAPVKEFRCVPGSQEAIPFPFLISAACLSIIPIISFCVARHSRLTSNVIAFVTMIEPFGMLTLLAQAKTYGIQEVLWLTALAVLIHGLCNIFMLLVYCNQLSLDSAFKHWQ
jgi:hypothetical protein